MPAGSISISDHKRQLSVNMLQSPTAPTSWLKISPLEVLITRACEPSLHEPNYALHLEVAEYMNSKKANTYVLKPSILEQKALIATSLQSKGGSNDHCETRKPQESAYRYPRSCTS